MEKTTKILVEEHKNILKVIDALDKECDKLHPDKEINKKFFMSAINFIRNYADKFHHAKEEDILFKEMLKGDIQENLHCNPIDQMLREHDLGRDFVKGMEEGVSESNPKKIAKNARGYIQLLREHIYKEDNVLYPMSEEALNKKTQQSMYEKFMKIEKERKAEKEKHIKFVGGLK